MALITWEDRFANTARRLGLVELEIPRIYGNLSTAEGLQDRVNARVAARLLALERAMHEPS